jgi:hypothetical protein
MTTLNRRSDRAVAMELMAEALGTLMASNQGNKWETSMGWLWMIYFM